MILIAELYQAQVSEADITGTMASARFKLPDGDLIGIESFGDSHASLLIRESLVRATLGLRRYRITIEPWE